MRSRTLVFGVAAAAVAAAMVLGCSTNEAPSTADVSKAFSAVLSAESSAPPANTQTYTAGTYTNTITNPGGGSAGVLYTSSGNPALAASTIDGTLTFASWFDAATGYTLNGTLSFTMSVGAPDVHPRAIALSMACNLSLAGGTVSTFTASVTISTDDSGASFAMNGAVTADGHSYDVSELR